MLRLRTVAIAALAVSSLVLASCGSSSNPLDSSPQSSSPQSSSPQPGSVAPGSGDARPTVSSAPASGAPIVIGSGNFTESELVAEIYAAALNAKGIDATTHLDIGSREVYLVAMKEGAINLVPEYTGSLLAYYDAHSTADSAEDVYAAVRKALPGPFGVLNYSPAQDQDSVTVTKATAAKYHLTSIGDLAPVAGEMILGGGPEWLGRANGPSGMKKLYGVVFKDYKVLDSGGPLAVKGLATGLVQATDIFTTNPAITENDFVVLKDPKNLFQAQNLVPLIAKSVATPQVTEVLNAVSAKLTTSALTDMQKTIGDTKANSADVAGKWVTENNLG